MAPTVFACFCDHPQSHIAIVSLQNIREHRGKVRLMGKPVTESDGIMGFMQKEQQRSRGHYLFPQFRQGVAPAIAGRQSTQ